MKRTRVRTMSSWLAALTLGAVGAASGAPEPSDSPETGVKQGSVTKESERATKLSPTALLKQALASTEGKTPEEIVAVLAGRSEGFVGDPIGYTVALAVFRDAYGEQAEEKLMQAQFHAAGPTNEDRSTVPTLWPEKLEHPLLIELHALASNPVGALDRINKLTVHPNTADQLRGRILASYAETNPREALALVDKRDDVDTYGAKYAVFRQWSLTKPAEAYEHLKTLPPSSNVEKYREVILSNWLTQDTSSALNAALDSPISSSSNKLIATAAKEYMRQDPIAGLEWLNQQPNLDPGLLAAGVETLQEIDPKLAYELLRKHPATEGYQESIAGIASNWARKDLSTAYSWASELPAGEVRSKALEEVLVRMGEVDPARLMAELSSKGGTTISASAFRAAASQMAAEHPEQALSWARRMPDTPAAAFVFGKAAESLLANHPERAAELVGALTQGRFRSTVLGDAVSSWMSSEPEPAGQWIVRNADRPDLASVLQKVAPQWMETAPQAARQFVSMLKPGAARSTMLDAAVKSFATKDFAANVAWLSGLTRDDYIGHTMERTFSQAGARRPEEAKKLISTISDPDNRDMAISGTVQALWLTDVAEAAKWLAQQPIHSDRALKHTVENVVYQWTHKDPVAAGNWVLSLPPNGKLKQAAALAGAPALSAKDLSVGIQLINFANSGKERSDAIVKVLKIQPDEASRNAFVAGIRLSPDERQMVLEYRQKNRL